MAEEIPITAFCLCIPERKSQWTHLGMQCESINIKFYPCFPNDNIELAHKIAPYFKYGYNGRIDHRWKHALAFMSHQEMIYIAKKQKLPRILMLEDDAYITERYVDVMNKLSSEIKELDFDILYFGWWIGRENDYFNKTVEFLWEKYERCSIMQVNQSVGLHGALINESAYETILNMSCINCMDAQIGKSNLRCYAILPKIIHVKNIKSEMEDQIINRREIPSLRVNNE